MAKDNEYLIEVHAAAANFFDILQVQGKYQNQPRGCPLSSLLSCSLICLSKANFCPFSAFPWIAGAEFAGIVVSTPRKSSGKPPRFPIGTRVFGAGQGAFATKLCVKEGALLPVPEGWSFRDAAGLYVTAPTSYGALVVRAGVKAGDVVLVHAAAGGVGLAAVQGESCFFFCFPLLLFLLFENER